MTEHMGFAINKEDTLAIVVMRMDFVAVVVVVKLAELSGFAINMDFIMARNSARFILQLGDSDRYHMHSLIVVDNHWQ